MISPSAVSSVTCLTTTSDSMPPGALGAAGVASSPAPVGAWGTALLFYRTFLIKRTGPILDVSSRGSVLNVIFWKREGMVQQTRLSEARGICPALFNFPASILLPNFLDGLIDEFIPGGFPLGRRGVLGQPWELP